MLSLLCFSCFFQIGSWGPGMRGGPRTLCAYGVQFNNITAFLLLDYCCCCHEGVRGSWYICFSLKFMIEYLTLGGNLVEYEGRDPGHQTQKVLLKPISSAVPLSLSSLATSADSKTSRLPDDLRGPSEGALTMTILWRGKEAPCPMLQLSLFRGAGWVIYPWE